jgi:PAS domain-containing protein
LEPGDLFGYAAEEVVGKSILSLLPTERQDEQLNILARVGRGEHVQHYETVRLRKDGRRVAVSLSVSPIMVAARFDNDVYEAALDAIDCMPSTRRTCSPPSRDRPAVPLGSVTAVGCVGRPGGATAGALCGLVHWPQS